MLRERREHHGGDRGAEREVQHVLRRQAMARERPAPAAAPSPRRRRCRAARRRSRPARRCPGRRATPSCAQQVCATSSAKPAPSVARRHVIRLGGQSAGEAPHVRHADRRWRRSANIERIVRRVADIRRPPPARGSRSMPNRSAKKRARHRQLVVVAEPAVDVDRADRARAGPARRMSAAMRSAASSGSGGTSSQ